LLADSETGTVQFEQEMVEILAMEDEAVQAEAAVVIRHRRSGAVSGPVQRHLMAGMFRRAERLYSKYDAP